MGIAFSLTLNVLFVSSAARHERPHSGSVFTCLHGDGAVVCVFRGKEAFEVNEV